MSKRKRNSLIAVVAIAAVAVLSGCSTSEPEVEPTATEEPTFDGPVWNSEVSQKPPFVISGKGEQKITIDFPAGFEEVSFVTLSGDGDVTLDELDYDGKTVGRILRIDDTRPEESTFKYPTEDTPSRTSEYLVKANDSTSWSISAEAILSLPSIDASFVTGNTSKTFIYTGSATVMDYITVGTGTAKLSLITPNEDSNKSFGGGRDSSGTRVSVKDLAQISDLNGYVISIAATNPDTQQWSLYFSTPEFESIEIPRV